MPLQYNARPLYSTALALLLPNHLTNPRLGSQGHLLREGSLLVDLGKALRPDQHPLLPRRGRHQQRHRPLATDPPPKVCSRITLRRHAQAASLLRVVRHQRLNLPLNVRKRVKRDIRDFLLDAVLFEAKAAPGKEDVCLSRGREVADAVANEDDQGDCAVVAFEFRGGTGLLHAACFVVAEIAVVQPERLPLGAGGVDGGVVGHDFDVCRGRAAKEGVEDTAEDGLEASGDYVKGDRVGDAAEDC
jgi:hypothetical protein